MGTSPPGLCGSPAAGIRLSSRAQHRCSPASRSRRRGAPGAEPVPGLPSSPRRVTLPPSRAHTSFSLSILCERTDREVAPASWLRDSRCSERGLQMLFQPCVQFLWVAGSRGSSIFKFSKNLPRVSHRSCTMSHSHPWVPRSQFLTASPALAFPVLVGLRDRPPRCGVMAPCSWIGSSPVRSEAEPLFCARGPVKKLCVDTHPGV